MPSVVALEADRTAKDPSVGLEAEEGPRQHVVKQLAGLGMVVVYDEVPSLAQVLFPDVHVHSVFPVRMPHTLRGTGEKKLTRHEEIVRDGVGGQVREISVAHRQERLVVCAGEDLLAHVPVVTMASLRHVFLGERDVSRH